MANKYMLADAAHNTGGLEAIQGSGTCLFVKMYIFFLSTIYEDDQSS